MKGFFKYTPSVVLFDDGKVVATRRLDEWHEQTLQEWSTSIRLQVAQELTPTSYTDFEKQGLPMLLMFVDLKKNQTAITEMVKLSRDTQLRGKISFAYADGQRYKDKMTQLGIRHGSQLPSMAFNTKVALLDDKDLMCFHHIRSPVGRCRMTSCMYIHLHSLSHQCT